MYISTYIGPLERFSVTVAVDLKSFPMHIISKLISRRIRLKAGALPVVCAVGGGGDLSAAGLD